MTELMFCITEKNRKIIGTCLVLLVSLLMMRFIVVISQLLFSGYPSFRIMMGLDLFFVLLIPFLVIFLSADSMDLKTSFLLPVIVIGFIFPVCDAMFLNLALLVYPGFYIPLLIGGFGFGFIGLAGNHYHREFTKSILFFTIGMAVILLNSASFIPITYFVITGNPTSLMLIPGL
jgi:hypothetical protein